MPCDIVSIVTYRTLAILTVATCVLGAVAPAASAAPGTVRVSVSSAGVQGDSTSGLGRLDDSAAAVSADGRFVAFVSAAANLVPGDTNGVSDVFVRDLRTNTTERVSVSTSAAQGDDASSALALAISPSGRYVTFTSDATNLAPGNDDSICAPEPCPDVYIRDRSTGATRLLLPFQDPGGPDHMVLSAGARFFAYDDTVHDGIVRCRRSPRHCAVAGRLPPTVIIDPFDSGWDLGGMSAGGRFVLFDAVGFNEAPNHTTQFAGGVFVRDVRNHTTRTVTRVVRDRANGISPQGRFVLFTSRAGTVVPGDSNRVRDVFVRDLKTGATHRISVSSAERQSNHGSAGLGISSRGRYCLFASKATDLVRGDTNAAEDLFLRDRVHGRTIRIDVSTAGAQANAAVRFAALSSDGRWAAFTSSASNLVAGDTNGVRDVFARGPLH